MAFDPMRINIKKIQNQSKNLVRASSKKELDKDEFHNPYTFIPFPEKTDAPERHEPSFLTADENTTERRYTGVLNLTIEAVSPLLSMDSENRKEEGKHFKYKALKIGNDVIVPATSVRGSLRTLMTILSGGTLGYMDKDMWLCQGRDLSMNIYGKNGAKKTELAEVMESGDSSHDGKIQRGITKMVPLGSLRELFWKNGIKNLDDYRPVKEKNVVYWFVDEGLTKLAKQWSSETPWKLKLSGTRVPHNLDDIFPVNQKLVDELAEKAGINLFDRNNPSERSSTEIWVDSPTEMTSLSLHPNKQHPRYFLKYNKKKGCEKYELNTYGQEAIFKKSVPGLEETVPAMMWGDYLGQNQHGCRPNLNSGDLVWLELDGDLSVKSLQWARWGRGGKNSKRFRDSLPEYLVPDSMRFDSKVDMVTDMFGVVSENKDGVSFASRVRCHNLVFEDAAIDGLDEAIQLAPLAQPHPGCEAFYCKGKVLNGYKVYRNAVDGDQPWLYNVQGVFDPSGWDMEDPSTQKLTKTVDLLKPGQKGRLKISFRALSENELSLLVTACKVDWKLGGGKPLGLGHCKVTQMEAIDENGELIDLNAVSPMEVIKDRIELYKKSQKPVERLRYPRAFDESRNKTLQHSGLQWFKHHVGMARAELKQTLPSIRDNEQQLYGYDRKKVRNSLEDVNPREGTYHEHGPNTSPNAESNFQSKLNRNKGWKH
jgi:CRISPR-associated protein (TIGR03986 family)